MHQLQLADPLSQFSLNQVLRHDHQVHRHEQNDFALFDIATGMQTLLLVVVQPDLKLVEPRPVCLQPVR